MRTLATGPDQLDPATTVDEAVLERVVRAHLGRPRAALAAWTAVPLAANLTNLATAALLRVSGTAVDGGEHLPWSIAVKRLYAIRHSPGFAAIPEPFREEADATFPWRAELDAYGSDLGERLPDGFRMPAVHLIEEDEDGHATIWMEDVATLPGVTWDLPRYRRAAYRLGQLAARRPGPAHGGAAVEGMRYYFEGVVCNALLPALRDPATWGHPLVAASVDERLRDDLLTLGDRGQALVDAVATLPQTYVHGDACPQNLLVPADDPDGFVAIDWSFSGLEPVGHDLSQLLAGGGDAGWLDPEGLAAVHATILPAYLDGLRTEGFDADPATVELGYVATLVIRSAFSSLPLEHLAAEPTDELRRFVARRAAYARFLADLGLGLTIPAGAGEGGRRLPSTV